MLDWFVITAERIPARVTAGTEGRCFRRKSRDYTWSLRVDGELIADSGEGCRRSSYAIKKAEELFPSVALVIDES